MDIAEFLDRERDAIIGTAVGAIRRAQIDHYTSSLDDETLARIQRLFDQLHSAVRNRDLGPLVRYTSTIADERFNAGFRLSEVQTAMNALEEAIWSRMIEVVPPRDLGSALGLVSTALGAGKDALARAYVSLATRSKVPSLDVRELFAGRSAG
jgi:hypothetical protein